jgi:vacuolar-type H+-ATPase subunit E/Vma4
MVDRVSEAERLVNAVDLSDMQSYMSCLRAIQALVADDVAQLRRTVEMKQKKITSELLNKQQELYDADNVMDSFVRVLSYHLTQVVDHEYKEKLNQFISKPVTASNRPINVIQIIKDDADTPATLTVDLDRAAKTLKGPLPLNMKVKRLNARANTTTSATASSISTGTTPIKPRQITPPPETPVETPYESDYRVTMTKEILV